MTHFVVLVVVLYDSSEPLSCTLSPVDFDSMADNDSRSADQDTLTVLVL